MKVQPHRIVHISGNYFLSRGDIIQSTFSSVYLFSNPWRTRIRGDPNPATSRQEIRESWRDHFILETKERPCRGAGATLPIVELWVHSAPLAKNTLANMMIAGSLLALGASQLPSSLGKVSDRETRRFAFRICGAPFPGKGLATFSWIIAIIEYHDEDGWHACSYCIFRYKGICGRRPFFITSLLISRNGKTRLNLLHDFLEYFCESLMHANIDYARK